MTTRPRTTITPPARTLTIALAALLIALAAGCPSKTRVDDASTTPPPPVMPSDRGAADTNAPATENLGSEGFTEPSLSETDNAAIDEMRDADRLSAEALNAQGVLGTVYFGYDSSALEGEALATLEANAAWLRQNPRFDAVIEGHCDDRGSTEYNLALGARRAMTIRDHLVRLGVEQTRLSTLSFGEEKPAEQGQSEAVWAKNRRAEFRLVDR